MYMYLTSNEPLGPIVFRGVHNFKLFLYFGCVLMKRLGVKKFLCAEVCVRECYICILLNKFKRLVNIYSFTVVD